MSALATLLPKGTVTELNDKFRRSFIGGIVLTTSEVHTLTPEQVFELTTAVRSFEDFTEDNDPHEEHDLGIVEMYGQKWMWKIEYYERPDNWPTANVPDTLTRAETIGELQDGAEDPTNPNNTVRVLTIMNAAEY